jgi:hypothetical protein
MPDTDKVESKPESTEDPETTEEHPLDAARREGQRLAPLSQTQHLDTSEGGLVDLRTVSPVFEEARQHAVRQGALAADEEFAPDTVIFPDDKDEADRARRHVKAAAAELPDPPERPAGGYADGQGSPLNADMVEKDTAARAPAESSDGTKTEGDKSASTTTAKTPAKTTTSSSRTASSKTSSK